MQYLLLITVIILISLQNVFQKQYNIKDERPNIFLFGAFSSISALIFFVLSSGFKLNFTWEFVPYSVAFAITYATASIGIVYAMRYGSMAISTLVISYSLLIPTAYGVIFVGDDIGYIAYIGIAMLLISIFLLNTNNGEIKFSFKWIIWLVVTFSGNGLCSTIQKMQQITFSGNYKNEFMIIALSISGVILLIASIIQRGKCNIKACASLSIPSGFANGIVNLFVMLLTGSIPNAILFPSISAGGIVLSFIIAIIVYKERLSKVQLAGYILGISSIILLNL